MRHLPLLLALGAACNRGGLSDDPPPGPGPMDAPDLGAPPDLAPAQLAFLAPTWTKGIQGGLSLWGPYVATRPGVMEVGDTVVAAFTKGYRVDPITVGEGDPGQAQISGNFKPVLLWLDRQTGAVQRVRQVAADQSPTQRASVVLQGGLSLSPAGDAILGGQFHGSAIFHPGTPQAQSVAAETRLVGGTLHRAEDPFFVRYGEGGAPRWLARGRTPAPLTKTWFNYGQGVAALPGGGALVVGVNEDAGFLFGDGAPGATTLQGAGGYLARLNDGGSALWVLRHSGALAFWRGVRAAADGAAYVVAQVSPGATLAADSPSPVPLPTQAGRHTLALFKADASGKIAWVRRIVSDQGGAHADFAVTTEGRVVLSGRIKGKLDLLADGDRVDASRDSLAEQAFVASWDGDGALRFLVLLGAEIGSAGALSVTASGDAWVSASAPVATRQVALDGGRTATLPKVMEAAESSFTLLYRITPAGQRASVHVLGVNFPIYQLAAASDGGLFAAGAYGAGWPEILIGDGAGGTRRLPPPAADLDQQMLFLAVSPGR